MDPSMTARSMLGMKVKKLYLCFNVYIYFVLKQFTDNCFVSSIHSIVESCIPIRILYVWISTTLQ